MSRPWEGQALVAIDTSSTVLSVAAGSEDRLVAQVDTPGSRSSAAVMELLDRCLDQAELTPSRIDGLLVLTGPGSFTGLRVGLALAMGLQQSLDLPVGTFPTLDILAAAAGQRSPRVTSVVAAGRARWQTRAFATDTPPTALGEAIAVDADGLRLAAEAAPLIGFDLASDLGPSISAPPLAAVALSLARHADWEARLTEPLYMAPPPADPRARRDRRGP